ncbi:MAG: hypothetical protein R3B57_13185 [Phycisphaerales bacterium]
MNTFLIVTLIVVGLGALVLLAAIVTGLAEKHKTGHLPGRKGGAKRSNARKGKH